MMAYTIEEKYKAVVRELALRRAVYPKWVAARRMSQDKADYEIAVMEAIVADYALAMRIKDEGDADD